MADATEWREVDRHLTRRVARWTSPLAHRVLAGVRSAAEHTKLWWGAAAIMAAVGGGRGRTAAAAGLIGMGAAELVSNAVCKPLYERRRPPEDLVPHSEVRDRPDSSSFPSGHTAAAVGFTVAAAGAWPAAAAACAVPAAIVAVERVHSGAHYPSDVAAGAAIGMATGLLVRRSPRLLLRHAVKKARIGRVA
ncbi:phosphatase PAP2 family protein [Streptomyces sp. PKU-EA00015]|uniref:phosphatase PAP2 family protein n=1 Tax=Streptomyces sp. PKU-EA00015 TaxID=2748326 RepID=UPI0015A4366E|nr:phosphatase PAP2 family protein [Streptomyces sp. PKU-EA00015]NWF29580.1 phosphatase PAP2 family protein [Streptomyces sp. PKU-EA00015]